MTTSVDAPASAGLRSYDASAILSMLPHRWPFLLIDGAFDVDPGRSGKGVKNVSLAEPYFAGHFPGDPIVPGVLIIEALAQLTAIVYVAQAQESGHPAPASTVGYLGAINRVSSTAWCGPVSGSTSRSPSPRRWAICAPSTSPPTWAGRRS